MVTRMRGKGQVTIPAGIRESLHLSKGTLLSVTKVGDGVLLTPKSSAYEAISARFGKAAKDKGITLVDLLKDLKTTRHKDS